MITTTGLDAGLSAVCRMEDLLSAVAAVVPHVGRPKDGGGVDRVRVVVDAGAMRLALLAGDRTSAAVALAPLLETDEPDADDGGGGGGWVADLDLTAPSARVIPAVLDKAGGDTAALTVDPIRRTLRVADASGLLEGRAVKVRAMGEWVGNDDSPRGVPREFSPRAMPMAGPRAGAPASRGRARRTGPADPDRARLAPDDPLPRGRRALHGWKTARFGGRRGR